MMAREKSKPASARGEPNVVGVGYGRKKAAGRDDRVLTILVKDKGAVSSWQLGRFLGSPETDILEVGEVAALTKKPEPK